jgi:hypothetical protein
MCLLVMIAFLMKKLFSFTFVFNHNKLLTFKLRKHLLPQDRLLVLIVE